MCTIIQVDVFNNGWEMTKTCQKQALFTSFRDFTVIFLFYFFDRFLRFKNCFKVIYRVLYESLA